MNSDMLRQIPQVDEVLRQIEFAELIAHCGRRSVTEAVRQALSDLRRGLLEGENSAFSGGNPMGWLLSRAKEIVSNAQEASLRRVINCTGIPLHTNLGRAPLAKEAIAAIVAVAQGYSTLEYDIANGERGSRQNHVRELLKQVTGAEDALVVNNNAGAVLLVLSALAAGREVVVSRGELVEVGGAFRIPEVLAQGGAMLREVGTTNRTYADDYEQAITPCTAAFLKVHTSNYQIVGFTAAALSTEIVALAHKHNLLAIEDLGSGVLVPLFGEPTVPQAVATGMDIVTFSGDKLLGGPQAGIIVGKRELIATISKHPLARALRIDKLSLAALEATLRLYIDGEHEAKIPLFGMLAKSQAALEQEAISMAEAIAAMPCFKAEVIEARGQVGGGSLPGKDLIGSAVALDCALGCAALEQRLRQRTVPIIARIEKDRVLLDLRSVLPGEDEEILAALREIACVVKAR